MRNACRILVGKLEWKIRFRRHTPGWEDNVKMIFLKIGVKYGLNSFLSR
jgi:hypothetical protein